MRKKNPLSYSIFLLFSIVLTSYAYYLPPINILSWDTFGYYLYLPFGFIYDDLGLSDQNKLNEIITTYHNTATFYQANLYPNGNWVIRYSSGMSIMYSPFFFISHLFAKFFGYPTDGFSKPYQYSILTGSLLYSIMGIYISARILLTYFKDWVSACTLFLIAFGTNYFIHSTFFGQGAMTHNYLFTLYALLVWFTLKWYKSFQIKYVVGIGICCGLITLTRPSEIVCALIPLLWSIPGNRLGVKNHFALLLKHKGNVLICMVIAIAIGSIQLFYWKYMTGNWIVYSYGGNNGEGFEFLHPFFKEVLFSFRKGWLTYTPIMGFTLIGFFMSWWHKKEFRITVTVYFLCTFYIISSWSCWWYAGSFGQRALIPSYAVLLLPLGSFVEFIVNYKRRLLQGLTVILMVSFVILNLFQSAQMFYGIIDESRMTQEYYFRTFGKLTLKEEDKKYLLVSRPPDGNEVFSKEDQLTHKLSKTYINSFEDSVFISNFILSKKNVFTGSFSELLTNAQEYSTAIEVPYYMLTSKDHAWLKISCMIYFNKDSISPNACIVATFNHKSGPYKFKAYPIKDCSSNLKPRTWNKVSFYYLTAEARLEKDTFGAFVWNNSTDTLYVDDLQVEVFESILQP